MQKMAQNFNRVIRIEDLGGLIQEKRRAERLTLAAAAEQSGVSAPTLSRLERQHKEEGKIIEPDTRTLAALTQWLGVSVEQMLTMDTPPATQPSTPEVVKAHLRADRKLNPEAAEKLATLFQLAYDQFAKPTNTGSEGTNDKAGKSE